MRVHIEVERHLRASLQADLSHVPSLPFDSAAMQHISFWQHLVSLLPPHQQPSSQPPALAAQMVLSSPTQPHFMQLLLSVLPSSTQAALRGVAGDRSTAQQQSLSPSLLPALAHTHAGGSKSVTSGGQQLPSQGLGRGQKMKASQQKAQMQQEMLLQQQHAHVFGSGGKRARKAQQRAQNGQLEGGEKKGAGVPEQRKRRKRNEASGEAHTRVFVLLCTCWLCMHCVLRVFEPCSTNVTYESCSTYDMNRVVHMLHMNHVVTRMI